MFKIVVIAALVYIFYKITFAPQLKAGDQNNTASNKDEDQDYIDYEEVE